MLYKWHCMDVDFQNIHVIFFFSRLCFRIRIFIRTKCPEKVRYIFGNSIYSYLFVLRRWSRYPFLVTWPFKHIFIHTHNMKHLAFIQNIHACRPRVWSSLFSRLIRWDLVSSNTNRNDLNQSCTIYSTVTLWMYRTQNWRRRKNIIKRNTHSAAWQM